MAKQIDIFGNEVEPPRKHINKEKRNWENAFQSWSNKEGQDELTPLGICGFGSMCDYCEDNTYGRPCVRALNEMCRVKNIKIDYSKREFNKIWEGDFE